jgi:hypothetical protein
MLELARNTYLWQHISFHGRQHIFVRKHGIGIIYPFYLFMLQQHKIECLSSDNQFQPSLILETKAVHNEGGATYSAPSPPNMLAPSLTFHDKIILGWIWWPDINTLAFSEVPFVNYVFKKLTQK